MGTRHAPRRAARRQANTNRVIDVATTLLADEGWRGFNLHRVSLRAGASGRLVHDRADSKGGLGALLWQGRLATPLIASLEEVLRATTEDALVNALTPFLEPHPQGDATAEILVLSHFDPNLREGVDATLGHYLRSTLSTGDEVSARAAFRIALALGVLLIRRHPEAGHWHLEEAIRTRARALARHVHTTGVPDIPAPHMDADPDLAPDDPRLHSLLTACLTLVATHGYDDVTVRQIARTAGHTEGLIYSRYATKQEMFLDAVRRQQQAGWDLNHMYVVRLESDYGPAMAEAIQWQQFQRPGRARARGRALALEQLRMSWRDAALMSAWAEEMAAFRASLLEQPGWAEFETEGDFLLNVAAPLGFYLLPQFVPHVDQLPYDVVTRPLYEECERQR